MTMYHSLLSASVCTFLCTQNLEPEEATVTAVQVHRNWVDEVLSRGSKWWLPDVWNATTYYTC